MLLHENNKENFSYSPILASIIKNQFTIPHITYNITLCEHL